MFGCMSKKRDRSQGGGGSSRPIQQQPNIETGQVRGIQPKPRPIKNKLPGGPLQQEDPLAEACWQGFSDSKKKRQRQGRATSSEEREQNRGNGAQTERQLMRQVQTQESEPDWMNPGQTLETDQDRRESMGLQNLDKYLRFRTMKQKKIRFQPNELDELKRHFKKLSSKERVCVDNGRGGKEWVVMETMNKDQFRSQMGLLGGKHHPYLADRMFEVFDRDEDSLLVFDEFAGIMDVLCNGSEDEKNQFSFALMDNNESGTITFEEFYDYFSQVISHWSSLINSHVRVNRQDLYRIFRAIDVDDDKVIRYSEYRRALKKNPDLVDWFSLLNSAKTGEETTATPNDETDKGRETVKEAEDPNVIKIDKEKVDKIVKLKEKTEMRTKSVHDLKKQVSSMQGETQEQLMMMLNQITKLSNQMQEQLIKREEDKKQWEESVLIQQQQETLSQFDPIGSHLQTVQNQPAHDELQSKEAQLYSQLIEADGEGDNDMPFVASPDAIIRVEREDPFLRTKTRAPAMTFGIKQTRTSSGTGAGVQQQQRPDVAQDEGTGQQRSDDRSVSKQEFDSNATLQQWQQKGLLQKTNNGSNSPTGQSSNFHFSQFNYEFTTRNPSMRIEESSNKARKNNPLAQEQLSGFDDRILRTHDNLFDGSERVGQSHHLQVPDANGADVMMTKFHKGSSDPAQIGATQQNNISNISMPVYPSHSPIAKGPQKTYEEILGPNASLNDILNFDFAGRYQSKAMTPNKPNTSAKKPQQSNNKPYIEAVEVKPADKSISPIFEVLIKLRQGREHAKDTVGEKRIAMEPVQSKQKLGMNDSPNRVNQKVMEDDDDHILDPESPIGSASHSPLSNVSGNLTASQKLKVNQRHMKRQEMRGNNVRSFESQSAMSNKLSQNQGGQIGMMQQAANYYDYTSPVIRQPHHQGSKPHGHLAASMAAQFQNHDSSQMVPQRQNIQQHAQTGRKEQNMTAHGFSTTNPHSPIPRMRNFEEDQIPMSQLLMNTSGENDEGKFSKKTPREMNMSTLSGQNKHLGKSAYDHGRMDTMSQFSQFQNNQAPKSSYTMMRPPPSPKAEKEILSQLDEVKSQVTEWLQKLEKDKKSAADAKSKSSRTKSEFHNRPTVNLLDEGVESSAAEEVKEEMKVIDELRDLARQKELESRPTTMIDTTDGKQKKKQPASVSFQDARPAALIVSSKHSHGSNSPETANRETSHSMGTFTNAHQALADINKTKKNPKDKTFIHFGNDNWNLVLHMLFGIRQSVHTVMYDEVFQLTDAEFKSKMRYEFEGTEDQKIWNLKKYEFYDFCPRMFNLIRKFYGIKASDYLKSIGPESLFGSLNMGKINSLKSQCSAGKSGSLFYYTADGLFMLKTISHDEFEHFKTIMKNYYNHVLAYPHTMITRFVGLHKIKFTRTASIERVYFVIMANVFNTSQNIKVRYDLKGSTYGRTSRKNPNEKLSATVALKDCDWLNDKRIINLRQEQRNLLAQQLKADTKFFQDNNINDYSVLLGIAKLKGGPREAQAIIQESPDFDLLYLEGINNGIEEEKKRKASKVVRTQSVRPGVSNFEDLEGTIGFGRIQSVHQPMERNDSELLLHERERPEKAFFESQDGGMISADGTEIYFMGIIDILTNFGAKKWCENKIRSLIHNPRTISCLPPYDYGERFYRFMTEKVYLTQEQISEEIRARSNNQPSKIFNNN